jgi:hypothetical protein
LERIHNKHSKKWENGGAEIKRDKETCKWRNRKQGWHWGERQTYSMIESFRGQ